MSDQNNQANTFRERSNKYKTEIKHSGQKNIYRDSDVSKTDGSENFDTEAADKPPELGDDGAVPSIGNASVA